MISALRAAASGMIAQQQAMDVVASNLANASTPGYKRQRANFEDVVSQEAGDSTSDMAGGVRLRDVQRMTGSGPISQSGNPNDLAIKGNGYFPVTLPDGTPAYTRDGTFSVDSQGQIVNNSGQRLAANASVPAGATDLKFAPDGRILATVGGQQQAVGTVQIATFPNASGLEAIGANAFKPTAASGPATLGGPGTNGVGSLDSGSIEGSNVDTGEEMVNMLLARRAYALNVKSVQTIDDMLQQANSLTR